jgi:hypothetical protein
MPASTVLRVPPTSRMSIAQAAGEFLLFHQPADLVDLAPQAQHNDGGEICMPVVPHEGMLPGMKGLRTGHQTSLGDEPARWRGCCGRGGVIITRSAVRSRSCG